MQFCRELNALETGAQQSWQRLDGKRFARPRHALNQNTAVAQQRDEQTARQIILAAHIRTQIVQSGAKSAGLR